ncbi:MAG: hypothetical protein EOO92_02940 [Pedobacter sp.]|nr:MAG: hypothetical protein EOO92_02940 [Pedobacter sp.]
MPNQLTANQDALSLFFTEDIYLVQEPEMLTANQASNPVPEQPVSAVPTQPQQPVRTFKFLGNNKRNILILVNDKANDVSDENGRELLRKIVKSINLTAQDFALLNYASCEGANFNELISQFSSSLIFSFGVSPMQLQLENQAQNTIVEQKGVKMIFSGVLHQLDQDLAAKKTLWGCLQKLGL